MARIVSSGRVSNAHVSIPADFYRQEFIKHRECLAAQREYFSERAITDADAALARVLGQLEQLCAKDDADQVIGELLRKFNAVTGLSGWSDPKQLH
jgi:thiamine pyrophosphate-dependent acetolactate synthase large subunit-like protein